MLRRRHLLAGAAIAASFKALPARAADPGVSPDKITFGQAAALDGPAASLGKGMRDGIAAAFGEVNRAGGVKGRHLDLVSRDDGYEPTRSVDATHALIEQDRVFALVGAVGTPTSQATQPIAAEAGVPFIAPMTGAAFLRDPNLRNVVNIRASYSQETEVMVERLTKDLGAKHISVMYQDDAFGRAGLDGVKHALDRRGMEIASAGTYERNTTAVRGAVLDIERGHPDAVIMIGAYKPCAEFIRVAQQVRLSSVFVNISFVGTDALAHELGSAAKGVVVTQVVPFPRDASVPLVARYQAALQAYDQGLAPGFISLEGYIAGRLAAAALDRLGGEPTREALLSTILGAPPFDLDGFRLTYGPGSNQGSDEVYLTVLQEDGTARSITNLAQVTG